MKTTSLLLLFGLAPAIPPRPGPIPPAELATPPVASVLPLKWKVRIGQISYRTEPALANGKLFIGSNGSHFNDYALDSGNGVYVLNAKTGKELHNLGTGTWGDLDVNGVVAAGDRVIFGNDNDEFLCYSAKDFRLLWRKKSSGDCEHVPTLIRRKGGDQIVVCATEVGEIRAMRPSDGSTVWVHYAEDFSGWKPGDSRAAFAVAAPFQSGYTYFTPPAVRDLNGDGVRDLIYYAPGSVVCISGQTGAQLLRKALPRKGDHLSPCIIDSPQGPCLVTAAYSFERETYYIHRVLLPSGKELAPIPVAQSIYMLAYTPPEPQKSGILILSKTGFTRYDGSSSPPLPLPIDVNGANGSTSRFIGSRTVTFRGAEVLPDIHESVYQRDGGLLRFLHPTTLHTEAAFMLPDRCESRPHLLDVDADGSLELLYGCRDGYLYCHEIP